MFENLRNMWVELADQAKMGLIAGISVIVLAMALMTYWLLGTDYEVLFSDLEPQDSAAIVTELERMKVEYQLAQEGTRILVDVDEVHETRLKLMGKGVNLSGAVGFEIFDNSDIGMTEYAQKINYQRALQGELARTIGAFKQVKHARVHLVLPESSIFKQKSLQPKASVSLIVIPGSGLNQDQISGIQRLIAAAVPGLETNKVTIVDQTGVTLTRSVVEQSDLLGASNQLAIKKQVEGYLNKKVMDVLDRAFGPGQAIVSIDASLNMDHVKHTLENIIPLGDSKNGPTGVIVRKRQSYQRPANGVTKAANLPYIGDSGRASSGTSETEYEISKKIEQVVSTPGGIKRLSVGVLVPKTLSQEGMDNIRNIVAMAVGLDIKRGDGIALHSTEQFSTASTASDTALAAVDAGRLGAEDYGSKHVSKFDAIIDSLLGEAQSLVQASPRVALGVAAGTAFLFLLSILWLFRAIVKKRQSAGPSLSKQERELLLAEIKQWVSLEAKNGLDHGSQA